MIFDFKDFKKFPMPQPSPTSSLEEHLLYLKKYLFDLPYPRGEERDIHDSRHAIRTLLLMNGILRILKDLRIGETYTWVLDDDVIYMSVLISAFLHDAGREDDCVDEWENDSGTIVYRYLTQIFGIQKSEAKKFAEAVANKDYTRNTTFRIIKEDSKGEIQWIDVPVKTIEIQGDYQKTLQLALLIQFGDCLEINRALGEHQAFDTDFLDLYNQFAKALEKIFPRLLIEERRLLELMGDGQHTANPNIQKNYKKDDFFTNIVQLITDRCPLMANYCLKMPFIKVPQLPLISASNNDWQQLMDEGVLLYRGIVAGSAHYVDATESKLKTLTEIEVEKVIGPDGNPQRSTSMLGFSTKLFSCVGGIIKKPSLHKMVSIFNEDSGTGFKYKKNIESLSLIEKNKRWNILQTNLRLGKSIGKVTEIEYDISQYDAIGYTFDPTEHENHSRRDSPVYHKTAILKAIYTQQVYAKQKPGAVLPLVEFSNLQHSIVARSFSDDEIIEIWDDACRYWLVHELTYARHHKINVWSLSIDELKIYINFDARNMHLLTGAGKVRHQAPDLLYSESLKLRVNEAVSNARNKLRLEFCSESELEETHTLLGSISDEDFLGNHFLQSSGKIKTNIIIKLKTQNLLEKYSSRIRKLIDTYFEFFIDDVNGPHLFLPDKKLAEICCYLYSLSQTWVANNPVEKYLRNTFMPRYQAAIKNEQNIGIKKDYILKLISLAAEIPTPDLLREIFQSYYSIMSTLSTTSPEAVLECEQFYDFCKKAKQLDAHRETHTKLLGSLNFKMPLERELMGVFRPNFFGVFDLQYENIFDVYFSHRLTILAQSKLNELLSAPFKSVQLKPLSQLLNFCFNRGLKVELTLLMSIIELIDLVAIKRDEKDLDKTPVKLSHFLTFLVNVESLAGQQFSAEQCNVIRKKVAKIVENNPLENCDLVELEKCLTTHNASVYLGKYFDLMVQTMFSFVMAIEDETAFNHYSKILKAYLTEQDVELLNRKFARVSKTEDATLILGFFSNKKAVEPLPEEITLAPSV